MRWQALCCMRATPYNSTGIVATSEWLGVLGVEVCGLVKRATEEVSCDS